MPKLYVNVVNEIKWRGVFAAEMIKKGELIEECQIILLPSSQTEYIDQTLLREYRFGRGEQVDVAIALGNGSLYNHSSLPNAMYIKNLETNTLMIRSLCEIKKDEEICFDYLSHGATEQLWFQEI